MLPGEEAERDIVVEAIFSPPRCESESSNEVAPVFKCLKSAHAGASC